jgi:hypothetical protein
MLIVKLMEMLTLMQVSSGSYGAWGEHENRIKTEIQISGEA